MSKKRTRKQKQKSRLPQAHPHSPPIIKKTARPHAPADPSTPASFSSDITYIKHDIFKTVLLAILIIGLEILIYYLR